METAENVKYPRQLELKDLRWTCPEEEFDFQSTADIEPLAEIVGQPRAVDAITLGVNLEAKGYNIFVTGISGTGRTSTVKKIVEENIIKDETKYKTYDYCYVNNFADTDKPNLIRLDKGNAKIFSRAMDSAILFLRDKLPVLFESQAYQLSTSSILDQYKKEEQDIIGKFDARIAEFGFVRGQLDNGKGVMQPDIFIKIEEKVHRMDDIPKLIEEKTITEEQAEKYKELYKKYSQELFEMMRNGMKLARQMQKELIYHDKESATALVASAFEEINETFPTTYIADYLKAVQDYILDNLPAFVKPQAQKNPNDKRQKDPEEQFNLFKVNVILDNSETKARPVIIETNPTYSTLFGTIEKDYDPRGFWHSDFTKIRGGSLLQADQGFLLVNANELFSAAGVWQTLKRVLLYERLDIQPADNYFQMSQSSLKPEPINLNVKVVIIGGMSLYNLLYHNEKGFKKMFKVLAQFDEATVRNDDIAANYPNFIAKVCKEENISHLDKSGVAAIMEWSAEYAGSKNKISLRFSDVSDLIRESGHYASIHKHSLVTREDIDNAIQGRKYRYGLVDEKISRSILENSIYIDTDGERVGQINGLSVYSTGIFSFGKPARITATVAVGNKGIVNIEREAKMSGNIHNKGVMIISGFIYARFGALMPLSLTASIAFEQNYGGIDGDSASAAEIYVLLSAITNKPIKQSFAITGSMNQKGDIQPIGGLNEKITGFYELCRDRGFTGDQGVIVPEQNVKDLMLRHDIIEDVKKGNFVVHALKNIEDGIPLLFGIEAGQLDENGNYPPESMFGLTMIELKKLRKAIKAGDHHKAKKAKHGKALHHGQKNS